MNRKNVLITGCSSGIGQALAEEYLRQGYRVYATARNIANLAHLTDEQLFPLAMEKSEHNLVQQYPCLRWLKRRPPESGRPHPY